VKEPKESIELLDERDLKRVSSLMRRKTLEKLPKTKMKSKPTKRVGLMC
jgi:hypothetical protein